MNNKSVIRIFAIALALVCIYQLMFTVVTNRVESKAKKFANSFTGFSQGYKDTMERHYLDSVAYEPVYNFLFVKKYTYMDCKERELNLGLDLQGGMNVTMEVSQKDLLKALASDNPDVKFNQALKNAEDIAISSQDNYVDIFAREYKRLEPNGRLAALFNTKDNSKFINFNSTDDQVISYLKDESKSAIDRSFQVLQTRIDKFGVTQPNIQKIENSGRIIVELPGVDNPERVRKLLVSTASLDFWETYDNDADMYKRLDTINKTIAAMDAGKTPGDTANKPSNSSDGLFDEGVKEPAKAEIKDPQAKPVTLNEDSVRKADSIARANKDTDLANVGKPDSTKSQEEIQKENPLFVILYPYVNEKGELGKGAIVGRSLVKDTAKVREYLTRPEVRQFIPSNLRFVWGSKPTKENRNVVELYALKGTGAKNGAALDGSVVVSARDDVSPTGEKEVTMNMNTQGTQVWKALTSKVKGHAVAIVLDDAVVSAPNVMNEIPNGTSSITGNFTSEETKDLANILQSGKLKTPTKIIEEAVVGPTLGQESINAGLISLIIGLIAIILFMVFYYNSGGLIADLAVFANIFFIFGVLASLGAALTLPGIAGIVLTMAMAVDANVLIFERIKEELHHGKPLKQAISAGYKGAMSAIIDSNLTQLISGFVMLIFGTGPIFGFAIILIIGIFSSLFTAILLSRLIIDWATNSGREIKFETNISRNLFKGSTIDWVGKRKYYYIFSGIVILCGIGSLAVKGLSYGVDFSGGWSYVIQVDRDANTQEISNTLKPDLNGVAPEVKSYGSGNKIKITTTYLIDSTSSSAGEQVKTKIIDGLQKAGYKSTIVSQNKVGATIASDTKRSAFIAIFISVALIFVYIVFRFTKWQFGLGASISLFHDVLIIFSVFTLLDGIVPFSLEIDQAFVAAMLTVMGYSMSDTVVVFDRIREFLNIHRGEKDQNKVINDAVNNTLNRTIVTSFTIFIVCLILFLFGGTAIKSFSFALLIGIIVGTYSSICIATSVVIDFGKNTDLLQSTNRS